MGSLLLLAVLAMLMMAVAFACIAADADHRYRIESHRRLMKEIRNHASRID